MKSYIENEAYYKQNISEIRRDFTPLYLKTYLNSVPKEIKDNIDEVIYIISDGIVERFTNSVRGYINDRG